MSEMSEGHYQEYYGDSDPQERYECPTCCYATNNYEKFVKHGETHTTRSGLSKDQLTSILADLHRRMESAENRRTPGGIQPEGVYWNGFHTAMQIAIERLERKEGE